VNAVTECGGGRATVELTITRLLPKRRWYERLPWLGEWFYRTRVKRHPVVVPAGLEVEMSGGQKFKVDEPASFEPHSVRVEVHATAIYPGIHGDVGPGTITEFGHFGPQVEEPLRVTNSHGAHGGRDVS
jgi:Baseplate J-like protein